MRATNKISINGEMAIILKNNVCQLRKDKIVHKE